MSTTKIRSSNQLWIDDVLDMGMSGTNLRIVSLAEPISGSDAATKGYVDAVKSGLDIKDSVRAATIGDNLVVLATTSTLTNNSTLAEFTLDGLTGFTVGTRVLIKDQTDKTQNGIYTVTNVGSASVAWVLTRALDFDNTPGIEVTPGAFTFVEEGNTNADSGWVLTTNGPITIGSSLLTFTQFSGAGQLDAGFGLTKSGNRIDIASTGGGSLTLTENSVNLSTVSVSNTNTGTNNLLVDSVTVDGYGRTTAVHRSDIGAVKWGSFNVTGVTTLDNLNAGIITGNTGTFSGVVNLNGGLNVNNSSTNLKGAVTIQGATVINNTLNVTGQTTLGNVNVATITPTTEFVSGTATINNLTVTGLTNVGTITPTTLNVSGTGTINSLNVTGTTTLNTLSVAGTSALRGTTTAWAPVVIDSTLNVTGVTTLGVTTVSSISSPVLTSTVSTGTAPLTVASTTRVANLNADLLDGYHAYELTGTTINLVGSQFVKVTGDTITGNLQISGNTNVGNDLGCGSLSVAGGSDFNDNVVFNGSMIENHGTTNLYGNTLAAAVSATTITSTGQIISTVTGVTAPFVINSSTVVSNLNADLLDGLHSSSFVQTGTTVTINGTSQNLSANRTWNVGTITGITVSAGAGLSGGGTISSTTGPTSGTITVSHADTSSAGNILSDNSNGVVIQDINFGLDTYGHVTSASLGTVDLDTRYLTTSKTITIVAGTGMTGGGIVNLNGGTITIGHVDVAGSGGNLNVTGSSGQNIQSITLGVTPLGHVTGASATLVDFDTRYITTGKTSTVTAGAGLTGGGSFTNGSGSITVSHADTSSAGSVLSDNSNGVVIQDINFGLDTYGHVTSASVGTIDLDARYFTEAESISKFLQVTGGTINGNIIVTGNTDINGVLSTYQFYSNSAASFLGDVTFDTETIVTFFNDSHFIGPVTANTMSVTSLGTNTINTTSLSATTVNATGQIISKVTTGTPPLVVASTTRVANLNADLLDGYHASDFTNAFRKYRLAPTVSSGTTVTFSYAGVNGGAITVQSDSFELFKNGLLMNDNNDYLSTATINTTAKTITFTVIDTIFNDSNPDVFLLNFSYTK